MGEAVWRAVAAWLRQGQLCLVVFLLIGCQRAYLYASGLTPVSERFMPMHGVVAAADVVVVGTWLPLVLGACDKQRLCIESGLLTLLIFTVPLVGLMETLFFLFRVSLLGPPSSPAALATWLSRLLHSLSCWDYSMLASAAISFALTASSWRIYRTLRQAGVLPHIPDDESELLSPGPRSVNRLEILCDPQDAAYCDPKHVCADSGGDTYELVFVPLRSPRKRDVQEPVPETALTSGRSDTSREPLQRSYDFSRTSSGGGLQI